MFHNTIYENTNKTAKTLSVFKFTQMFPDETSAIEYIEKILWKETPICPHCDSKRSAPRPGKDTDVKTVERTTA